MLANRTRFSPAGPIAATCASCPNRFRSSSVVSPIVATILLLHVAGIDVVSSQYATVAAEQSALERLSGVIADQIVGRVALFVSASGQAK